MVKFGVDVDMANNDLLRVGAADFDEAVLSSDIISIPVITPVQFDQFDFAYYRSAEYLIQLSQGTAHYQAKVLVIHNGTDIGISEYAQVGIGTEIPYIVDGSFSLDNIELTIECSTADITPVSMKFTRVLFDV